MRLDADASGAEPSGALLEYSQTIADIIKLMTKEDIQPTLVSPIMWGLAPILLFMAMTTYAVIPFDAGVIFADLNIGIFFFVAVGSQATLPLLMAGWASNNKFAMIMV